MRIAEGAQWAAPDALPVVYACCKAKCSAVWFNDMPLTALTAALPAGDGGASGICIEPLKLLLTPLLPEN